MISHQQQDEARKLAVDLLARCGFIITREEESRIEVADFGFGQLQIEGAQILTLVETERIGVKVIALTPWQTLPEHWHPRVGSDPGKEETVRLLYGTLYFYVAGTDTLARGRIPPGKESLYTLRHEMPMKPGGQMICQPGEKHWFQAGSSGAVAFSFSSVARDVLDRFTDPSVRRVTEVRD